MNEADNSSIHIETLDVEKVFKDFWLRPKVRAVNGLNLRIHAGEVYGLLGPNGSGKSTTVKLILGLLRPTKGYVSVFGSPPDVVRNKSRIGYLPEESYLYGYLNAGEILAFYGGLFGYGGRECRRRAAGLIDMVGLSGAGQRPVREYSKGMARRLGLAQALVGDPDLLILDEPTSGLDPIGTREIKDLIIHLKEKGKTVLVCGHLLADIQEVCDRIAIMYGGRIYSEGPVRELLQRKDSLEIYLPDLAPEIIDRIKNMIKKESGAEPEIRNPVQSLETFFLNVIEEARTRPEVSAGVSKGGDVPDFISSQRNESPEKNVLKELTESSKTATADGEDETPESETKPPAEEEEGREDSSEKRRKIIDDLSQ